LSLQIFYTDVAIPCLFLMFLKDLQKAECLSI